MQPWAGHTLASLIILCSQNLANIIWVYATAIQSHLLLIQKMTDFMAIMRCKEFNFEEATIFLWAFAVIGQTDQVCSYCHSHQL
jgi:hypothetical protein